MKKKRNAYGMYMRQIVIILKYRLILQSNTFVLRVKLLCICNETNYSLNMFVGETDTSRNRTFWPRYHK